MDQDLRPTYQELQIEHTCCGCGIQLRRGSTYSRLVVPIAKGGILSNASIAWCDSCWIMVPGPETP